MSDKNMVLGTRGHDTNGKTVSEMAICMKELDLLAVQFVPNKITSEPITSHMAKEMAGEFASRGIKIALLGCYFNLLDSKEARLEKSISRFKEHLTYAKDFGATIVGTETGSYDEKWGYHENNHSEEAYVKVLAIFKDLVKRAEELEIFVGIEAVYNHVIYDVARLKRLLTDLNSQSVKLIFDPVNLFNPKAPETFEKTIEEYVATFSSDRVALVHAKDFILSDGVPSKVRFGEGLMNYKNFLSLIKTKYPNIPIIIEEQTGDDLLFCKKYLLGL